MAKLKLIKIDGSFETEPVKLSPGLIANELKQQPVFDAVLVEQASWRQGTHSILTKGEVRGGGKKPYKQKHTGKARQGSTRNPHFVGGGIVFGPKPNRNYSLKLNKKAHTAALHTVWSEKLASDNTHLVDQNLFNKTEGKTKVMMQFLKSAKLLDKNVLFVVNTLNTNLEQSTSNIKNVQVKHLDKVSVRDLMLANALLVEKEVLKALEGKFK
ncbi:50S ribosomal protein L4 [Mycoplasmoides pneumoniae]|uniref:50S ribosomal protein L4 n=1 Tax=Mycoplasmoides pneumoniae TaxID=2104 RepID=UPI001375B9F0|nr:50S ribosomal protein L4 [Mycoplasmoides pneumoniae]QHR05130.1 50S ribosomal protein L4 [Mycoplasmoides pneumoniae]QHR09340.1 50S ribosomal protein L4 [Mycoplasmoides pneumoniae]GLL58336.1 50S ribosomal protein L4 [Mycoplasmoides pneumoniae]GLL60326.1 50S ribosomal protein L4 [Mycoplasmoides pneumoniae]